MTTRKKHREQAFCAAPGCGRHLYSSGLCQTHLRQKHRTGKLKPIRPYRKRTPGTVKFAGLRLTARCADKLRKYAEDRGISHGAAIAYVLEDWVQRGAPRK